MLLSSYLHEIFEFIDLNLIGISCSAIFCFSTIAPGMNPQGPPTDTSAKEPVSAAANNDSANDDDTSGDKSIRDNSAKLTEEKEHQNNSRDSGTRYVLCY